MSKFGDLIASQATGYVKLEPAALSDIHIASDFNTDNVNLLTQYRIGIKYSVDGFVRKGDAKALHAATKQARRALIEDVFGEFRKPLLRLSTILAAHDIHTASEILDDIIKEMFE